MGIILFISVGHLRARIWKIYMGEGDGGSFLLHMYDLPSIRMIRDKMTFRLEARCRKDVNQDEFE